MLGFIVNPIAGGKKGKKIKNSLPLIENRLKERNIEYKICLTEKKGDGKTLTEKLIDEGASTIIVVGGDGTLHEVINGFKDFDKVSLGIIPLGTGNDFANALNLSLDPVKALDAILDGTPTYVDFMQMPTVRGLNVIGMGLDVEVLKRYEKLKKKTKFGYTLCLLKTLLKFKCVDFSVLENDNEREFNSFIACIANGHCFGGGINICPTAKVEDNKLNFVAVSKVNKFVLVKLLIKLLGKKIHTAKQFYTSELEKIKIIPKDKDYTINVDGELYDNIPFEIKIVSNTLKVVK